MCWMAITSACRASVRGGTPPGRSKAASPSQRWLAWQCARSHEELIDGTGALAAFADGPNHQRLTAAHVARGEQAIARGAIVDRICQHIPRLIEVDPRLVQQRAPPRTQEAHRQQHEVRLHLELAA